MQAIKTFMFRIKIKTALFLIHLGLKITSAGLNMLGADKSSEHYNLDEIKRELDRIIARHDNTL